MIEVSHLSKSFQSRLVLDDVSFTINRGDIVALLGPNGAGKTTTMRILTGFLPYFQGSVKIAGQELTQSREFAQSQIGYLPEHPPLYPEMSVDGFLSFVATIKQIESDEIDSAVDRVIAQTDLESVRHRIISRLSKGFQQRIGFAQALLAQPPILILDEPTVGLDPNQIIEIRDLIANLRGRQTVLISTHILSEATLLADRVIILQSGKIVAQDSIDELTRTLDSENRYRLALDGPAEAIIHALRSISDITQIQSLPSIHNLAIFDISCTHSSDFGAKLFAVCAQNNWPIYEFTPIQVSLEEVFAHATRPKGRRS